MKFQSFNKSLLNVYAIIFWHGDGSWQDFASQTWLLSFYDLIILKDKLQGYPKKRRELLFIGGFMVQI